MATIAVVTDSSAYLPAGTAEELGIGVVSLQVTVDGRNHLDGNELDSAGLVAALGRRSRVTTSRPSPAEFGARYTELLAAGAPGIVSVHLSRALSGTWEAARLAADQVDPSHIRVVDSRSAGMGLGFAAMAASAAAANGADLDGCYCAAVSVAERSRTYFSVDTLEHLRRGGRIGPTAALVGTALSVKPLLHMQDGRILPLEKVRTSVRARARLVDLAVEAAGTGPVELAVHHLDAPERAAELAAALRGRLPISNACHVSEVGAALGAHAGPGMLGVVVLPGGLLTAQ